MRGPRARTNSAALEETSEKRSRKVLSVLEQGEETPFCKNSMKWQTDLPKGKE